MDRSTEDDEGYQQLIEQLSARLAEFPTQEESWQRVPPRLGDHYPALS